MKKLVAVILLLSMLFSFTACAGLGALKDLAADFEKWEKTSSNLKSFKLVLDITNTNGDTETMTEMRCDKGYALIREDSIYFVDYEAKKSYTLTPSDGTGYSSEYSGGGDSENFGALTYGFLFFSNMYRFAGAKKGGSEKINGRKSIAYSLKADGEEVKFWLDDEFGITVKYSKKTSEGTEKMEVTEFKTKGITMSDITDMVNLSKYEISEY